MNPRGGNNFSFSAHWNEVDVRGALYAQQGRTCCFCGRDLVEGDRGDVEHFRPKGQVAEDKGHGGYWWKAYDFDNYVLSCRTCNSNHKRSHFPLRRANAVRVTFDDRGRLPSEARLLPDPAVDEMERLIRFEWRSSRCKVYPAPGISDTERKQVEGMIELFKLNKRGQLARDRFKMAGEVTKLIAEGKFEEAGKLAIRYRPHSLLARQILIDANLAQHLPDEQREFEWHLGEIRQMIKSELEIIVGDGLDYRKEKPFNELLWSMAVLHSNPPAGAPGSLKSYLTELGLFELVDKFVQKMA